MVVCDRQSPVHEELNGREEMDNKRFERIKSSFAFRCLYYWEKSIGMNPLTISKSNELEFSYAGLVYGCGLTAMYILVLYYAWMDRVALFIPGETPIAIIVDYMGMILQFIHNSLSWLIFAFRQKRLMSIVKKFVGAENTSVKLGIPEDYDKYFREFGTSVTINSIIFFASLALSMAVWSYYKNFDPLIWVSYTVMSIGSFNVQIIFVWALTLVKNKFHRLNERVESLMRNDRSDENETNAASSPGSTRCYSSNTDLLAERIGMVSQLHRELRDVVSLIEGHFAMIILFAIVDSFTWLTVDIYDSYFYMKATEGPSKRRNFFHVAAVSHWMIINASMLIAISKICGSTIREANNTGNILHAMLNNCPIFGDTREAAKLNVLSLDLLHNRVSISVLGFFNLDDFLIYGTIATITAYLTIMLQL